MAEMSDIRPARRPFATSALLALAAALTLASHNAGDNVDWSMLGGYVYWIARIGMAFLIIIGAYAALAQVMTEKSSPIAHAGLAAALSFPPFVMAVTTLDLAIGDLAILRTDPNVLLSRLGIEAASLIDNHVVTSAMLLAPYLARPAPVAAGALARTAPTPAPSPETPGEIRAEAAAPPPAPEATETPGLLLACQPPIRGDLLAAEAQEHYVKLKATEQGGMALYRFGDAVRELGRFSGMQIHRSHWVADEAVEAVIGKRGSLKIEITGGEVIPVSRRYELEVEARYADRVRRDG